MLSQSSTNYRTQRSASAVCAFVIDLIAWYCVPAAFLFVYVSRHFAPIGAVLAHLRIVSLPLCGLALLRLMVSRTATPPVTRLATAFVASALFGVMILYYALVLIGLQSWGRVVSWDLITSYADQAFKLADALGLSAFKAIAVAALAYLALLAAAWAYLGRFDWTRSVVPNISKRSMAFILFAGIMVCTIEVYAFRHAAAADEFEPVSLTFYPSENDLQGHGVDRWRSAKLDAAEDEARASYLSNPNAQRRNLILIIVDALRPDHLGIYGYARDTTPNLAHLEKAGVVRKAASMRASCSSSICGILSISTSKFLHQFSDRPITLKEVLKRHGYRVHMMLSGDHTLFYGLKKIYGDVDSYFDARQQPGVRYLNDDRLVLEHLSAFPDWDGVPVMMQFHLMSAHILGRRDNASVKYVPAANYAYFNRDARKGPAETGINFYDNGVLQADTVIRDILDTLGRKGYLKDAVVAITADHGEAIGEHGYVQHANSVREEVLRVPFIVMSYGYTPTKRFEQPLLASQVDIAPTLLAELGIPRPATWQGTALQEAAAPRHFVYFQERWEIGLYDLRDPANVWKYWLNSKTGEDYAFNLTLDPGENINVLDKVPAERKREWRLHTLANAPVAVKRRPDQDR